MKIPMAIEELIDPPMARRPLSMSRAWLAAFVLALVAIGWTAAISRFDAQVALGQVVELDTLIGELNGAAAQDQDYLVLDVLSELDALAKSAAVTADKDIAAVWERIRIANRRLLVGEVVDRDALGVLVLELEAAFAELSLLMPPSEEG